jgi:hypothetical protein
MNGPWRLKPIEKYEITITVRMGVHTLATAAIDKTSCAPA